MKRRDLLKGLAAIPCLPLTTSQGVLSRTLGASGEKMLQGAFEPTWESLEKYTVPSWFRDAKFGIWAHWGPQCQPEHGDWYARSMYIEGDDDYNFHLKKYGHPSKFGFKDVIHSWKAENWDPEHLITLYKNAGAKYFFALANHHDNFDNFNSRYQSWNSTVIGPKKDLVGGWAAAARKHDLKVGLSVHASHAWTFYEKSQKADLSGPYAGIPYDGNLSYSDGHTTWWDGYDPQALYAQKHAHGLGNDDQKIFYSQWYWSNGASIPNKAYCEKFFNRTIDLINQYSPDALYFDDTVLPLYPISDAGLRIAAHLYNSSMSRNQGKLEAVLTGKGLNVQQRKCMVWDIERGHSNIIEPLPWQTDTCLGDWHYDRRIYDRKGYKSAKTVIHTLIDVVSKNGNLLLNVPVRGDGTLDSEELAIVAGITGWMKINSACIYGTRPWKINGEGPASETIALTREGFNEGKGRPFTGLDYRFTQKQDKLFAISLGLPPEGKAVIKSLSAGSKHYPSKIGSVQLTSTGENLSFERNAEALSVRLPESLPDQVAYSFSILPS